MKTNANDQDDGRPGGASIADSANVAADEQGPPASSDAAVLETDIDALQERIKSLKDTLLRTKADLQNFQRRAAGDRSEAVRFANADLLKSLLGVIDDFDRTLAALEKPENTRAVVEGIRLVHRNLLKALGEAGLEPIDAEGKSFDPRFHEALMQQPSTDAKPGTVLEQVAPGYKLRDRVLRPARVIVAAGPPEA